jgi:hypothetical protein
VTKAVAVAAAMEALMVALEAVKYALEAALKTSEG